MKRNYNVLTCKMSLFINTMLEFYFSTKVAFAHLSNLEILFKSYYWLCNKLCNNDCMLIPLNLYWKKYFLIPIENSICLREKIFNFIENSFIQVKITPDGYNFFLQWVFWKTHLRRVQKCHLGTCWFLNIPQSVNFNSNFTHF